MTHPLMLQLCGWTILFAMAGEAAGAVAADASPPYPDVRIAALKDRERRESAADSLVKEGATVVPSVLRAHPTDRAVRQTVQEILVRIGAPAVPALTGALDDGDAEVRQRAVFALSKLQPKETAPFVKALDDENADVRMLATDALGRSGVDAKRAVPALLLRLGDKDERVRIVAVKALAAVGAGARDKESVVEALIPALKDKTTRSHAADALATLGEAAVPQLLALTAEEDRSLREAAVYALGTAGRGQKSVVSQLAPLLGDPNADLRLLAAHALSSIGAVAVPALTSALADAQLPERHLAALALARLGPQAKAAVRQLTDSAVDRTASADLRAAAVVALGEIGPDAKAAVRALKESLPQTTGETRMHVGTALWQIARDPAGPRVVAEVLESPENAFVRLASARALANMGTGAKDAVPVLAKALGDKDPKLQAAAARALANVGARAKDAVPQLKGALGQATGEARMNIGWALWTIDKDPRAETVLLESLVHKSPEVREASAAALAAMGGKAATVIPALTRALDDTDKYVRAAAAMALAERGPEAKAAATALSRAMPSATEEDRVCIAYALWKIDGRSSAIKELIDALAGPHAETRRLAAGALGRIGSAARDAVTALNQAAQDDDPRLRQAAQTALAQIKAPASRRRTARRR